MTLTLPLIDVAALSSTNFEDRLAVAKQIRQACLDKGFSILSIMASVQIYSSKYSNIASNFLIYRCQPKNRSIKINRLPIVAMNL